MRPTGWSKRFWASTRGRIVLLLRRASRTVNELAQALDLTDNAVRGQLALLERDGLVHQSGRRAGKHKPNLTYALTPEAQPPGSRASSKKKSRCTSMSLFILADRQ